MASDPEEDEDIPPEPSGVVIGSVILFVLSTALTVTLLCAVFWPNIYDWVRTVASKITD